MDRATRKELKTDHFVEKVGAAVSEILGHKQEVQRYGIIAAVVVVLIIAGVSWYRYQAKERRADFDVLLRTMEAPVAPPGQSAGLSFATEADKDKAISAALEAFSKEHAGTNEDALAHYFVASNAIEERAFDKALTEVELAIQHGNSDTAAIARFMKANILAAQGKDADAEKIYRELLNTSSGFVTQGEVTLALAKVIAKKSPDEAIKLLEPLRLAEGSTQRIASQTIEEIRNSPKN
ncbi:MAG: tetratricopeptide repeat protein [Bryobacterales bacterium]|nr:tetratricopeptide repeat protein [Bryobacterales bacterium]